MWVQFPPPAQLNMKPKLIVILGQTATGKSDLAVQIARRLAISGVEAEVISADSRQVYKGLDLGSGKITKKEMMGIPHHLLDVANPKKVFNVSDYKKLAQKAIADILKRGKIPILCGGTGFYIDSVVNNITLPDVPPNLELRKKLTPKSAIALFGVLQKLDPERAKTIDKNNPVRLIRAIEIATALGKVPQIDIRAEATPPPYEILFIGLDMPDKILKDRIYQRIINRNKKGMIKEVKSLHKNGLSWKRMNELGLEYRYISQYLQNKITKNEMINKLNAETSQYAKRQKTWFKRNKNIDWYNPLLKSSHTKINSEIKKFLQ